MNGLNSSVLFKSSLNESWFWWFSNCWIFFFLKKKISLRFESSFWTDEWRALNSSIDVTETRFLALLSLTLFDMLRTCVLEMWATGFFVLHALFEVLVGGFSLLGIGRILTTRLAHLAWVQFEVILGIDAFCRGKSSPVFMYLPLSQYKSISNTVWERQLEWFKVSSQHRTLDLSTKNLWNSSGIFLQTSQHWSFSSKSTSSFAMWTNPKIPRTNYLYVDVQWHLYCWFHICVLIRQEISSRTLVTLQIWIRKGVLHKWRPGG